LPKLLAKYNAEVYTRDILLTQKDEKILNKKTNIIVPKSRGEKLNILNLSL